MEPVRIVALGGLGEIGMNCMSIEHGEHRMLVDCGITFPDEPFGAEVIRPDFRYLAQEPKRHQMLWLTHGHEDHVGAVPYLLREHAMPVFGPPYALALVRERLVELPPHAPPRLTQVLPGQPVRFGPFEAEAIRVTHSIADATSLALKTPAGTIVHTADFKIDPTPTDHEHFDRARFQALGDQGVRLLLSDSTNVDSEGTTGSEADVERVLWEQIEQAKGRVLVTLFASNTHRLRGILAAARRSKRKLCLLGRSVQTHTRIARELGYLGELEDWLVSPQQGAGLPRQRILFAATGSQAEAASALTRIAHRVHPQIALDAGDTVILSSRIIPGNDRRVLEMIDALLRQAIEVVEWRTLRGIHVSGHAQREEQREMLRLVRPAGFMPVHGTYHHLLRHARLAREQGVQDVVVAQNGDVVELDSRTLRAVDRIATGRIYLSQGRIVPEAVLDERAHLAKAGALALSVVVDARGKLLSAPEIHARGVVLPEDAAPWLAQARGILKRTLTHAVEDGMLDDRDGLREALRRRMTRFVLDTLGQRVVCLPTVHVVRS